MSEGGQVGALHITLSLNSADFQKGMQDVNLKLKGLKSAFNATAAGNKDFEKSLDGMQAKSEYLSNVFTLQGEKVKQLRSRYEELKSSKGEDDAATQRMLISYNNALAALRRTESQMNELNSQITLQSNSWYRLGQRLSETSESFKNAGEKFKGIGESLSKAVTLPIVGLGAAAVKSAEDMDSAQHTIQAQLGLTGKEAENLAKSAQNVWRQGFGDSMDDVEEAISKVKTNMRDLNDQDIEKVTKNAEILAKTFDADVGDSTKTASSLMKNFGIDSTKAFDIMTTGFQKGGDYSGELLDTLNEYSVQFSSMGLSADQFLSILISGAQNGAFNLDKVGDAVKEFNIRAQDGSKTTAQGFQMIGLNAQQMGEAISKGGEDGQNAFMATVSALAAIKDPMKQNIAGTQLFGTQWEDVRSKVVTAMGDAAKNVLNVDGATRKAGEAIQGSFGQKMISVMRKLGSALEPIGEILLNMVKQILPGIQKMADAFTNMSPAVQKILLIVGGIAAAFGPLLMVIGSIASGIGTLISVFSTISAAIAVVVTGVEAATPAIGALAGAFTFITGPIGIAIAAIVGLGALFTVLYQKNEEFRTAVQSAWEGVKSAFSVALGFISNIVYSVMGSVETFFGQVLGKIQAFWKENGTAIMTFVKSAFNNIWGTIEMVMGLIKGIFQVVWPIISGIVQVAWASIKLTIMNSISIITGTIQFFTKVFTGDWRGAFNTALDIVKNIWGNIKNVFNDLDLASIGKNIIQGLVDGIGSMIGAVTKKIKQVASGITGTLKSILGIHSPSRVLRDEVGQWIPAGLAEGISGNIGVIHSAVNQMAVAAVPSIVNSAITPKVNSMESSSGNTIVKKINQGKSVNINANFYPQKAIIDEKDLTRWLQMLEALYGN